MAIRKGKNEVNKEFNNIIKSTPNNIIEFSIMHLKNIIPINNDPIF